MRAKLLASSIRKLVMRLRNRGAQVQFREPVYFGPGCVLDLDPGTTFVAGPRAHFRRGFIAEVHGQGRVEIGADAMFTYNTLIQCTTSITVGDRCTIGASLLVDGNHRFRDPDKPIRDQGYDFRPLRIADDVLITTGCVVMADVGAHSVVGANAVVTEPVPPNAVVGGIPARVISTIE